MAQPTYAASFDADFQNQKVVFLGDSITEGSGASFEETSYVELMVNELGFSDYINYGDGGSCITEHADRSDSFVERVITMDADADVVIIQGGINDYKYPMEIGVDPASTTATEMYGALNYIFDAINTKYPDALVIVLTPMQSVVPSGATTAANSLGYTLEDYRDAIVARANAYDFHTIDLYEIIGFNAATSNVDRLKYTSDGYHPNDLGHERIAEILCSFLDGENIAANAEFSSGGYLYGDTLNTSADPFYYTSLIPVKPGYTYVIQAQKLSGAALLQPGQYYSYDMSYNSDIPAANQINYIVTVPEDVYYISVNVIDANMDDFTVYEIINYERSTITYNSNGGSSVVTMKVETDTYATAPEEPTKVGYEFVGWYNDSALSTEFDFTTDLVTEDLTLYAKWTSTASGSVETQSPTTASTVTYELLGVAWYWWLVGAVGVYYFFVSDKGRKTIGLKKIKKTRR